jgi:cytochrome P450
MQEPRHVLDAPSHPQPYGWYGTLRATRPLFFDDVLRLWVASDPSVVRAALQHPQLRVRPPAEPVPRALLGRPTGEVFARLVRLNDGAFHARHRPEVSANAQRWSAGRVAQATEAAVADLAARCTPDALLSAIPVQAMARLLAVPDAELDATVAAVHAFTQGIAAGADAATLDRADAAAVTLLAQGEREGLSSVQSANRIALMQQSLDATAGLIGNAIAAFTGDADPPTHVARIARGDPAIHNTRRFAAEDLELGVQRLRAGEGVVLLLVDADGDLGFGAGAHACPGQRIALQLATSALASLQARNALAAFGRVVSYRPLPNARIPVFTA